MPIARRVLKPEEVKEITSLDYNTLTRDKIINLLANFYDMDKKKVVNRRYSPEDEFTLEKGLVCNNPERIKTTVGRYIFNVKVINPLSDILGYVNEPISKSKLENLYSKLSDAFLLDKISREQIITFFNALEWMFNFVEILTPSLTQKMYKPDKNVMKKKDELAKKYHKELEVNDVITGIKIEKELLDFARNELKDDPGFDLINSGAIGNFDNNYKNTNIIKGPMMDNSTGQYKISMNNLSNGIGIDEMALYADAAVFGAYNKGVGTQIAGYSTKKNLAAFQGITLGDAGSDCGTKLYQEVLITKYNFKFFIYSYIVSGSKLILLDKSNIESYIGKVVKMRSIMYCKDRQHVCNKCAGELFYMLGITNLGLIIVTESAAILNKFMKQFHDATLKMYTIEDVDELTI